MDERDELLREIDRVIDWATKIETRHDGHVMVVSTGRASDAVRRIAKAMEKARVMRGVSW